jgi:hypothetical protein
MLGAYDLDITTRPKHSMVGKFLEEHSIKMKQKKYTGKPIFGSENNNNKLIFNL